MKKSILIAAAMAALAITAGSVTVLATQGDKDDPLVTLSYLQINSGNTARLPDRQTTRHPHSPQSPLTCSKHQVPVNAFFRKMTHSPIEKLIMPEMQSAARLQYTTSHPKITSKSSRNPIFTRNTALAEKL